jgi:tetratricopeptide (TPR) repeat protein
MRQAAAVAVLALVGCTTPLQQGERLYREGDRLGALEVWREVPEDDSSYEKVRERIDVVESEFQRLVVQYKQRGRYYEDKERLAESILNYRLALKLEPDDRETLAHVQELARVLAGRKAELGAEYQRAFEAGQLPEARAALATLRTLDPFDFELETEERKFTAALRIEVARRMATGRRSFAAGDTEGALAAFRAALELDPDNESAQGYLSYIATLKQRREAAGGPAAGATFATDEQIRAEGFYQNALAAERRGDHYAAIRQDLRALEADPDHRAAKAHLRELRGRLSIEIPALIEAGRAAFRSEDLQSAIDLWRRALLVDPDNERIIAYLKRAEQQLQNLERLRSGSDTAGAEP